MTIYVKALKDKVKRVVAYFRVLFRCLVGVGKTKNRVLPKYEAPYTWVNLLGKR
jgi:hypothetical protein